MPSPPASPSPSNSTPPNLSPSPSSPSPSPTGNPNPPRGQIRPIQNPQARGWRLGVGGQETISGSPLTPSPIQNPQSKIQNPLVQNPQSKIQNSSPGALWPRPPPY